MNLYSPSSIHRDCEQSIRIRVGVDSESGENNALWAPLCNLSWSYGSNPIDGTLNPEIPARYDGPDAFGHGHEPLAIMAWKELDLRNSGTLCEGIEVLTDARY